MDKKIAGCLFGGVVGDAIGTTVEFMTPEFTSKFPVTDMVGGGKFELLPGQFTDDSSMMLCLAESLLLTNGFNAIDQQQRYWSWYENGHLSSNGICFDIGKQTLKNLLQNQQLIKKNQIEEICKLDNDSTSSGNGSLMRLAPIPLYFIKEGAITAIQMSGKSSLLTHRSRVAYDSCRLYSMYILGALQGISKEEMFQPNWFLNEQVKHLLLEEDPLCSTVLHIKLKETFKTKQPAPISEGEGEVLVSQEEKLGKYIISSAYVVSSMEAALWAFFHSNSFEEGVFKAANLADDADTVACIYGQLAGAYYGIDSIPSNFVQQLALKPYLECIVQELILHYTNNNSKCSEEFEQLAAMLYHLETEYYQQIQRKVLPGPFMFRTVEQFDQAVENWKQQMEQHYTNATVAMKQLLQIEFCELRAKEHRNKVAQRSRIHPFQRV